MLPVVEPHPRILVVDDEPSLGRAIVEMLDAEPVECLWVDSAADALTHLAFTRYELVITDRFMPKVGGLELLQAIEELDPDLPVVLVTDAGEPSAAVEAVRAGAFDFLWKPVERDKLLAAVERGLAVRREAVRRRELANAERLRLERRSALLSVLFEAGSDGALTWDARGRLVDLSPSITALTGVPEAVVLARGSTALFEREPFGGAIEDRIPALAREPGLQVSQEVVVHTREGPTPARLTLTVCELPPAEEGEQPQRWVVGLLQPPHHGRLRERLRRADRLASAAAMAGGAAHEIKNDLGPLLTFLSLIEDSGAVDEELREVLGAARTCVRRIEIGVERVLAPIRATGVRPPEVELAEIVRDAVSFVRRLGREPRVQLEFELEDGLPSLLARPDDIHQIVFNLVSNALEAIEAGRADPGWAGYRRTDDPRVVVRLLADLEHDALVLEVQDEGPGIAPEVQGRVFEPFFTTKGTRGTGLGLPVVRDLVRDLGGELAIVSAPTIAGTCVRVRLPRTR